MARFLLDATEPHTPGVHVMRRSLALLPVPVLCCALLSVPDRASACGGFFCNSSQPVNQQAERIIFTHDADGTVTAVIQIQYSGEADRFAWVLPVAGSPTVGVSSNAAFTRLQQATNPQYFLSTRVEGTCRDDRFSPPSSGVQDGAAAVSDAGAAGPPVTVVDQGSVGPYDYVVISIDPAAMPLSDVAVGWLNDNMYDITPEAATLLEPYLAGGMNLLAFRLTKGNDVGSIRPVSITFGAGLASIPIRPTAVASVENMGVLVWVLGEDRAVPVNYMSLELNEALLDWMRPASSYNDVVNAAADEAGGQGFVTEMAGSATALAETIHPSFERSRWSYLQSGSWAGREGELLIDAISSLGPLDGMRETIAAEVPLPPGVTIDQLLGCIACYYQSSMTEIEGFEPAEFLASIATNVIDPIERTAQLFVDHPYFTRFYTTMSAAEMTRDPSFDFNPNLGDVSNVHRAEQVIECSPGISRGEAPWRVTLPDGALVRGRGIDWPFTPGTGAMPANARILRIGTSGAGEVIEDNTDAIRAALRERSGPGASPCVCLGDASSSCACRSDAGSAGGASARAAGCACGAGASGSPAPLMALLALAGLVLARRR